MFLDGEIRKLGKKRGRTEINIMLKEGSCTNIHTHTQKENILASLYSIASALHLLMEDLIK